MAGDKIDLRTITELKEYIDPSRIDLNQLKQMAEADPGNPVLLLLRSYLAMEGYGLNVESTNVFNGKQQTGANRQLAVTLLAKGAEYVLAKHLKVPAAGQNLRDELMGDPLCAALTAININSYFACLVEGSLLTEPDDPADEDYIAHIEPSRAKLAQELLNAKLPKTGELTVFDWIVREAKSGNAYASVVAGIVYNGSKLKGADAQAIEHFESAVKLGVPDAQVALGIIAEKRRDWEAASAYYLAAAEHKLVSAQFCLGELYLKQRKFDEALRYLNLAADQNHGPAHYLLATLYEGRSEVKGSDGKKLSGAEIRKGLKIQDADAAGVLAYAYYERAAGLGYGEAWMAVARLAAEGRVVAKDVGFACRTYDTLLNERAGLAREFLKSGPVISALLPLDKLRRAQTNTALTQLLRTADGGTFTLTDKDGQEVDSSFEGPRYRVYQFKNGKIDEAGNPVDVLFTMPEPTSPVKPTTTPKPIGKGPKR